MFYLPQPLDTTSHLDYISKLKMAMQQAYRQANKRTIKKAAKGKRNYNRRVRYSSLEPGDRVFVRNLKPKGGGGQERLKRTGKKT